MLPLTTVLPVTIAAVAVAYRLLRIPKHDILKVKKMLYPNGKPLIIAHRAGASEAPENTLIAIETAYKNGATAVEIDLDFTKDDVPILHHDDDVDRTTNGSGKVKHLLYDEIKALNAAHKQKFAITAEGKLEILSEKIPTLMEAVELCRKHNIMIDLDIKSNPKQVSRVLKELLKAYPDAPNFILATSFYPDIIYGIRRNCPEYMTGLIWRYNYVSHTIGGIPRHAWYFQPFTMLLDKLSEILVHSILPDFLGVSVVVMNKNHLSKNYVENWRRSGYEVVAWTVNSPSEKEYLLKDLNVPIVTDYMLHNEDFVEQNN